jgi:citrate lyase beta subunit
MIGPIRSLLFVPGTRPDRFEKAMKAGADAVTFDLEDSVEPAQKEKARHMIAEYLRTANAAGVLRLVRFNALDTETGAADLTFFQNVSGFDGLLLPKVETPGILEMVARALAGRSGGCPPLMPLLESPAAIVRAVAIATADAPVGALLFGAEDFTARLAVPRTLDGEELIVARGQIVLAAAMSGAEPLDGVFVNLDDLELLRRDCMRARAVGFRGKMAIHPKQIPVINETFTPSQAEIDRAHELIEAFDAATAAGQGVTRLGSEMVELPVIERARRTVALAARYGAR